MDRRLTTIVAADLVGYSRLMAADEEGTISRLQRLSKDVIRPEIEAHGGRIVKTMGDGLLIEFPSTVSALKSTLSIQTQIAGEEAGTTEDRRMHFRVGINLGDVVIDGDDILGDGVNIAARLESLAPPGGICISRAVYEQVKGKVDAGFTALGPQKVKNIPDPVEVWQVGVKGAVQAPVKPTEPARRPSIVILPFDNMSSDPEQDFLADGIVEDVTTELSRFQSLMVIARNSAFSYKGTHKDVREIASELGVRYVVEGSVRRAGNRLRVTSQLIEAKTGAHIWAGRWDRTMEDLFDLQDELTSAIVLAIEPELGAHERKLARHKPTDNLTAWELCQRGFSELLTYTDKGYQNAFDLLDRACAEDPEFALAWAIKARALWNWISLGHSRDVPGDLQAGLDAARRAIALNDRLDAAYYPLGCLLIVSGRDSDAGKAIEQGLALNPNFALFYHARALCSLWGPEPDPDLIEADEHEALRLNPKDPLAWGFQLAIGLARILRAGSIRTAGAMESLETACGYTNASYLAYFVSALCHAAHDQMPEAKQRLEEALHRKPDFTMRVWREAYSFPIWPRFLEIVDEGSMQLVELGLQRE